MKVMWDSMRIHELCSTGKEREREREKTSLGSANHREVLDLGKSLHIFTIYSQRNRGRRERGRERFAASQLTAVLKDVAGSGARNYRRH